MKKFFVVAKKDIDITTIPSAMSIAKDFTVKWENDPNEVWRKAKAGSVLEAEFCKLQNTFEDSGFYSMYEDIQFHTS